MTTKITIKKLAASTVLAGSLGLAVLSFGAGLAAADTASSASASSSLKSSTTTRSATTGVADATSAVSADAGAGRALLAPLAAPQGGTSQSGH